MSIFNSHTRYFMLLSLAFGLTACGGGGGGGGGKGSNNNAVNTFTVSTVVGANGIITPTSASIQENNTAIFTVIPDAGHGIDTLGGCGGTLVGSTYITGVITADCMISASFIVDSTPPSATITFPPQASLTEGNTIIVRGSATDDSQITVVRVNNIDATSNDNFATWQATVNLNPGNNTLTVETGDIALNTNNAVTSVQIRTPDQPFPIPQSVVVDNVNGRALITDAGLGALVAVDLISGVRTVISDSNTPDATNAFSNPISAVLDSANNRALVIDLDLSAILAVDLTSGARTVFSDNGTPDAANVFEFPIKVEMDNVNDRLLVTDNGLKAILAVDLTSGARTILSNNGIPDTFDVFQNPLGLTLDSANNRALVIDPVLGALVEMNLTTGARTIVSDDSTPDDVNAFDFPVEVVLDINPDRVLVIDYFQQSLLAVDLTSGARTIISDNTTPDAINALNLPVGLALDDGFGRALIVDQDLKALLAVDLISGKRTILWDSTIPPGGANVLGGPGDLVLDSANNRLLVNDGAILAVNLSSGARTVFSSNTVPDTTNQLLSPKSMVLDSANNRLLVVDSGLDAVVAVNLTTGARTIISDVTTPDATNAFDNPHAIVLDSTNNRVFVSDGNLEALLEVNLATGARIIISDNTAPGSNTLNALSSPWSMALDSGNNRVLVSSVSANAVLAVDLTSGVRTILSGLSTPNTLNPLSPSDFGFAMDNANNRLLVLTGNPVGVYAVDLTTGARTIISNNTLPDSINAVDSLLSGLALDSINNYALAIDTGKPALLAIDLVTGQRVIISQ